MKNALKASVLAAVVLSLSACVVVVDGNKDGNKWRSQSDWEQLEQRNRESISELQPGQSVAAVQEQMGPADFHEMLRIGDQDFRILYYRTQRVKSDGITSKDECTPLVFRDGLLHGWGQTQLNQLLLAPDSLT